MSNNPIKLSKTELSSNLANVLFSKNTPFSLRLYTTGNKEDPFEQLSLKQDAQYYVAQLSLGNHFYQQTVLLKMYDQHDEQQTNFVETFTNTNLNENKLFPRLLSFEDEKSGVVETFPPLFYCIKQNVFFHVYCENCQSVLFHNKNSDAIECKYCMSLSDTKKQFFIKHADESLSKDDLYLSFGTSQGEDSATPCINCDNHSNCFHEKEKSLSDVMNNVTPVSINNFSLYAAEYTPLKLFEYNDLVGGMELSSFYAQLKKQNEVFRLRMIEKTIHLLSLNQCNIFSALNKKLNIFIELCDMAINLEGAGFNADEYMQLENFQVSLTKNNKDAYGVNALPCLLPMLSKNSTLSTFSATLHIQNFINANNNKNTVVEVFMSGPNDESISIALGDIIELSFGCEKIDFIVKQKQNKLIILESINCLKSEAERHFLRCFSNDKPQIVKYTLKKELSTVSGYKNLADLFYLLLLSNAVLGEIEIKHALSILYSKTKMYGIENDIERELYTVIQTTPALSVVFRQENTLYQPAINKHQLIQNNDWLHLLALGVKLSGEYQYNPGNTSTSLLKSVKNELTIILKNLSQDQVTETKEQISEAELIKSALTGIIDDNEWLDKAIHLKSGRDVMSIGSDKTVIYPKNKQIDDSTLIMSTKKRQ